MNPAARLAAPLAFCSFLILSSPASAGGGKAAVDECVAVGRNVAAAIKKNPSGLLPIVRKSLTDNADCTCEIVRAAILAADSDPDLIKEIVIVALNTVETRAAEIAECAVLAAPDSAEVVKSALQSVLGDGLPPSIGDPNSVQGIFLVPPEAASPANPVP